MAEDILAQIQNKKLKKTLNGQIRYDLRAAIPETSVLEFIEDPNLIAAVFKSMPSTILVNLKGGVDEYPQTMMHEFEHVLQNKASVRGSSYDNQVIDLVKKGGGNTNQLIAALEKSISSTKLKEHLKSTYKVNPSAYIGGAVTGHDNFSLRESFAELSSLEQQINKDLTKDPVVQQEFFNNDKNLIDVYRATTGLRQVRLDAKDLPPMTVQKEVEKKSTPAPEQSLLEKILNFVR